MSSANTADTADAAKTATADATSPASTAGVDRRRVLRATGIGGIVAFAFWLLQPLLVFVVMNGDQETTPRYELYRASPYLGAYEAITFGAVGVGTIVMVIGAYALARLGSADALAARVAAVLGSVAGAGWLAAAGLSLGMFTSVGYFVTDEVPARADQAAVYSAIDLVLTGALVVYGLAMICWLAWMASGARRAGVVGWPLAVLAIVAAVAACSPLVVPFAPPIGALGALVFSLVFGIVCLVRARTAGRRV